MHRSLKRSTLTAASAALLVLTALPNAASPATAADCDPSLSACRGLIDARATSAANQDKLASIQSNIHGAQERMAAISALIADLDAQINAQQKEIADLTRKVAVLDGKIRVTEADVSRDEAHIDVRNALLSQRVRAMDKHGQVDYVQFFVSSRSFTDLVDRMSLMAQVVSSDRRLVDQLRQDRDQLRGLREQLATERSTQASLLAQREEKRDELERNRGVQRSAYAEQAKLEAEFEAQRLELERQQAFVQSQISSLQAQYQAQLAALVPPAPPPAPPAPPPTPAPGGGPAPAPTPTPAPAATSGFQWPEGSHLITQGFGCTPYTFEPYNASCASKHWHTGVDIAGPNGTPIYASAAGILQAYPGSTGGYGNYVVILHAGGYSTLYGHLNSIAVSSGRLVQQGQVIGYEGSTGNSTGPHLHFEIRLNDTYQNPCAYTSC